MQISETLNEGLRRAYTVTIPAAAIASRMDAQMQTVARQMKMPGFRPGKAPAHLVKKLHGPAVRGQVMEEMLNEGSQAVLTEKKLRPAMQPKLEVIKHDSDLEFTLEMEVLPQTPSVDMEAIALEKWVLEVTDADLDEALEKLAAQQKSYEDAPEGYAATSGDAVVIDFIGKVDGEAFEGGTGSDMQVALGAGGFIPGFEEQLEGVSVGQEKVLNVTFPEQYQAKFLAGKAATFDIVVKAVKIAKPVTVDEELATNLGLESLDQLKDMLRQQYRRERDGLTRTHMKRTLLDKLAATYHFDSPQTMVEAEFANIWQQLEREAGEDADAKAKLEEERGDYQRIAERRVRLGLLLSELGQQHEVQITQAEMNRLIAQEASRYPGQQEKVVQFFQKNAQAAAQLRAPLYEEKVVDLILSKATLTEKVVSEADLVAALEAMDTAETDVAPKSEKKASAKKSAKAEEGATESEGEEKKSAKKSTKKKAEDAA